MLYRSLVQPLLFRLDAEKAHNFVFSALQFVSFATNRFKWLPPIQGLPPKPVHRLGLHFPNPLGLAAGFDKNGLLLDYWKYLGFGFVEIGTITPNPQVGNPKPRLFRLPADGAILNRMGFNNEGMVAIKRRLEHRPSEFIVGANIGKNKSTPNADAANDYCICIRELSPVVDYFVINVSSPNTPELRDLQAKEPLYRLLSLAQEESERLNRRPILVKIAPDLSESDLFDIIEVAHKVQIAGFVVCNTTISRSSLTTSINTVQRLGQGGISGKPLTAAARQMLLQVRSHTDLVIIGVGGVFSDHDAKKRLQDGADLIQLYTGFVYQGPRLIKQIISSL